MENHPYKTETAMMVFGEIAGICWDNLERRMFSGMLNISNEVYGLVVDEVREPVQALFDDHTTVLRDSIRQWNIT